MLMFKSKAAQALSEFKSKKLTEFYNAIDSGDKDDIREAVEGIKKYNSYLLKNEVVLLFRTVLRLG